MRKVERSGDFTAQAGEELNCSGVRQQQGESHHALAWNDFRLTRYGFSSPGTASRTLSAEAALVFGHFEEEPWAGELIAFEGKPGPLVRSLAGLDAAEDTHGFF
ncbi:hypothetical protein CB1_000526039 [Camelus ferus]|nr:hypothetical protein CB1_000526039 [Camelus ferus]